MKKFAAIAIIALLAAPAMADVYGQVRVQHTGVTPYQTGTIYGQNFENGITVYLGLYRQAFDFGHADDTGYRELRPWGFCIEFNYSTTAWKTYDVRALEQAPDDQGPGYAYMSGAKADYLRELWADVDAAVGVGPGMTAQQAAAFQAVLWEIIYEDNPTTAGYGAGNWDVEARDDANKSDSFMVSMNQTTEDLANTWLGWVTGSGATPGPSLVALVHEDYQDYITIPAPGAVLLGLMGLGIVGKFMRRFA